MKRMLMSFAVAASLAVPAAALACEGEKHMNAEKVVKKVTVQELAALTTGKKASILDANGSETRAKQGVIPGAILLTSAAKYDAAKELPADKDAKLVFYCANTKCTASDMAAKRALEAGYNDVNILPEGIAGWKQAGQKTDLPRS